MKRRSCSAATFPDDIHFLQLTPNRAPDASRDPARPQASSRLNDLGRVAGGKTLRKRSEEHTSELQSLMRISYAVFCLKKKKKNRNNNRHKRVHRFSSRTQNMSRDMYTYTNNKY